MKYIVISTFLLVFSLFACVSCCTCTAKACSDGAVMISLTDSNNNYFYPCENISILWRTEDSNGMVDSGFIQRSDILLELPGEEDVDNGKDIPEGTTAIELEIFCDEEQVSITEYEIDWQTYVCNSCGPSAFCDDDKATTGHITINLDLSQVTQ